MLKYCSFFLRLLTFQIALVGVLSATSNLSPIFFEEGGGHLKYVCEKNIKMDDTRYSNSYLEKGLLEKSILSNTREDFQNINISKDFTSFTKKENLQDINLFNDNYFVEPTNLNINKNISYEEAVVQNGGTSLNISIAKLFDMISASEASPENIKTLIEAINTNIQSDEEIVKSLKAIQPLSSKVYAKNIHTNTLRSINSTSKKLHLKNSAPWFSTYYSIASLDSSGDVVGYNDKSGGSQLGYLVNFSDFNFAYSLSYSMGSLESKEKYYRTDYNIFNLSLGFNYSLTDTLYTSLLVGYSNSNLETQKDYFFLSNGDDLEEPRYNMNNSEVLGKLEIGHKYENNQGLSSLYSIFYSLGSIMLDDYREGGITNLSINKSTSVVNDLGLSIDLAKEFYKESTFISLSPYITLSGGFRYYSELFTEFSFLDIRGDDLEMDKGDYLPIFLNSTLGISYSVNKFSISGGYTIDTNIEEYMEHMFFIDLNYSL